MKKINCVLILLLLLFASCKRYELITGNSRISSFLQDFPKTWVGEEMPKDSSKKAKPFSIQINAETGQNHLSLLVKKDTVERLFTIYELARENDKIYFKLIDDKKKELIVSCLLDKSNKNAAKWTTSDAGFPLPQNNISLINGVQKQTEELTENSKFRTGIMLSEWHAYQGTIGEDKGFYALFSGNKRSREYSTGRYFYTKYWQDIVLKSKSQYNFEEYLPQNEISAGNIYFEPTFEGGKFHSADGVKVLPVHMKAVDMPYKLHEISKKILEVETKIPFVVLNSENSLELSAGINQFIQNQFEDVYAAYGLEVRLSFEMIYFSNEVIAFEICSEDKKTLFQTVNFNIRARKKMVLNEYFGGEQWEARLRGIMEGEMKRLGIKAESSLADYVFLPQNIRFSLKSGEIRKPIYVPYHFVEKLMQTKPTM